uniref:dTDP-4-dehydrorhamnose reductase n=1 Tax=Klebsiella sp. SW4 TaxID=1037240 RepID=A0A0P0YST8_9ENTR|nr:dTDP-6-deoxy-L-mannose dehydrogenase/ dTDP-4-dehydrorhamnose reductase [Klebsiella sp. SW4]
MKVLLTGANGQLGRCFQDRVPKDWIVFAANSTDLDITNQDTVLTTVARFQPDIIINTAAYTAVDKAETEAVIANLVNNIGPKNLALAAMKHNSRFIHISTDYVFDGKSDVPYTEVDPTNPLGVYGKTKLDGEQSVANILSKSIILRTAWVFSEYGNNFLKTMLFLGNERNSLGIVSDQRGCPTYAGDIAFAIIDLIKAQAEGGIYHYCGDSEVSWFDFAVAIFKHAEEKGKVIKIPELNAITTECYHTPAKRPLRSTLDTTKIQKIGILPSDWRLAIGDVIAKL